MRPRSRFSCHFLSRLFLFFSVLIFCPALSAQDQPSDAAEITRDLLFRAPQYIRFHEVRGKREPIFISPGSARLSGENPASVAELQSELKEFDLAPKGKRPIRVGGADYVVTPHSDDDRATLTLSKADDSQPLVTAVLWTRGQLAEAWLALLQSQRRGLTLDSLRSDLEVADPILYDGQAEGDAVWVAVGYSIGEGEMGIGTIVRFDLIARQAKVFQPKELATCAVTQLALGFDNAVWLATRRQYEGTIRPCTGLNRLDLGTGQVQKITLPSTPTTQEGIVTALGVADRLWVATDVGICSTASGKDWDCQRIVPTVALKTETPVSNRPGEKPSEKLAPGDYEVLWANVGFYEVATKDSLDAWLAADDFAEAAARNFDAEPYKLLNTASPPTAIRLLDKPGGEPLGSAVSYRAALEKLPTPQGTPPGWVRVRARIGWIPRGDLQVVPKLAPVEPLKP